MISFILFIISFSFLKGSRPYTTGENSPQFGAIVGQVNLAHQPPMVRLLFLNFFYLLRIIAMVNFSFHLERNLTFYVFNSTEENCFLLVLCLLI